MYTAFPPCSAGNEQETCLPQARLKAAISQPAAIRFFASLQVSAPFFSLVRNALKVGGAIRLRQGPS
ncbi:MAG: hypothetical protein A3F90_18640 [Deltaproteobacteria bacterium RIFCSPLOWO2_12_FULL_60_19]|nr:MAG: hypothetical protein A3F90_18640 [Deltaproteobacteria bacterium RIFCSPLOWO2_12_FULL_60_19]